MEAPADRGEHRRGREAGGATGARAILAQPRSEGNAMSEIQIAARHVLLGADHHGGDAAMSPKELRRVVRWVERRKAHAARRELIRRAMRGYKPRDPNGPGTWSRFGIARLQAMLMRKRGQALPIRMIINWGSNTMASTDDGTGLTA